MIGSKKYLFLIGTLAVLAAGCAVESAPSENQQSSEVSSSVNEIVQGDVGSSERGGSGKTGDNWVGEKDPRALQVQSKAQPQPQPWMSPDDEAPQPQPWNPNTPTDKH